MFKYDDHHNNQKEMTQTLSCIFKSRHTQMSLQCCASWCLSFPLITSQQKIHYTHSSQQVSDKPYWMWCDVISCYSDAVVQWMQHCAHTGLLLLVTCQKWIDQCCPWLNHPVWCLNSLCHLSFNFLAYSALYAVTSNQRQLKRGQD